MLFPWRKINACILTLLLTAAALHGEIEFAGFFLTPEQAFFALTDTETKTSSSRLILGQSFNGYILVSFDRAHQTINLKRNGQLSVVPLKEAKVKEGKMIVSGFVSFGPGDKVDGIQASLFMEEESAFRLKDGTTFFITPKQLPDGTIRFESRFERTNKEGRQETIKNPNVIAHPGQSFGFQGGELGFSFTP